MHEHDAEIEALTEAIVAYSVERVRLDPPPLDRSRSYADLLAAKADVSVVVNKTRSYAPQWLGLNA